MRIDVPFQCQVGIDAVLIGKVSRHAEQPAAAHGSQRFHFETILVELERAMQLAQAVGQILQRQRSILKFNASRESGILEWAVCFNLESRRAAARSGQDRPSPPA